jgi:hypothetical protein
MGLMGNSEPETMVFTMKLMGFPVKIFPSSNSVKLRIYNIESISIYLSIYLSEYFWLWSSVIFILFIYDPNSYDI